MEENLVGYLLKALDLDTQREVEGYLRGNPEAQRRLELLRQALEPLAADREEIAPPSGLRIRTLARVAEYRCRDLPPAPSPPPMRTTVPGPSWWRRVDVLVAASLLFICVGLLLPWLAHAHHVRDIVACKANLSLLHKALIAYSDQHNQELPRVEEMPPQNFAGVFVPVLYDEGYLRGVTMDCPATGHRAPTPVTVKYLKDLYVRDRREFERYVRDLGGCYAYSLGYRDRGGQLQGVRCGADQKNDLLPIMADRPPFDRGDAPDLLEANSENHGGDGQNVLHLGGDVSFYKTRYTQRGDDIYLNNKGCLEPGENNLDAVLAASGVRADPVEPPEH
jgi:hypothetical protein